MTVYSITDISKTLNINAETIRRWIRRGELKATWTSKKQGYRINEQNLLEFVEDKPKYKKMFEKPDVQLGYNSHEKINALLAELLYERDRLNDIINKLSQELILKEES